MRSKLSLFLVKVMMIMVMIHSSVRECVEGTNSSSSYARKDKDDDNDDDSCVVSHHAF